MFARRRSLWLFVAVSLVLVALKLLFEFYPGDYPIKAQALAFSWPLVLGIIAIGFLGLMADGASGLPNRSPTRHGRNAEHGSRQQAAQSMD